MMLRRIAEVGRGAAVLGVWLAAASSGALQAEISISLDTPRAAVESLHRGLVEVAGDPALDTVAERFDALLPLVRSTHDFAYIAELTVRRQWPDFSPAQRTAFISAFERLSVMTYASRFRNVDGGTFVFLEAEEPDADRGEVSTSIHRENADDIPLDYTLERTDAGWRIINIIADGVSDLALKRAEYRRILSEGSVDDLIAYIEAQADKLE